MDNNKLEKTIYKLCKKFNISCVDTSLDKKINILKNEIIWGLWGDSDILLTNQDEKDFIKTAKMFGIDFQKSLDSVFVNTILPRLGLDIMYESFLETFGNYIDWNFFSKYSKWSIELLEKYKDKYVWNYCTNYEYDDIRHIFEKYPYLLKNSPWYITKYELRKKLHIFYADEELNLYIKEHFECRVMEIETNSFILDENIYNFVIKYNDEIVEQTKDLVDISFLSGPNKKLYLELNNFEFVISENEGIIKFRVDIII